MTVNDPSPEPGAGRRIAGRLLMAAGLLIGGLCGLGTVVFAIVAVARNERELTGTLILGLFPTMLGFGLYFLGHALSGRPRRTGGPPTDWKRR